MGQKFIYPPKEEFENLLAAYAAASIPERNAIVKDELRKPLSAQEFRDLKSFNWRLKFPSLNKIQHAA